MCYEFSSLLSFSLKKIFWARNTWINSFTAKLNFSISTDWEFTLFCQMFIKQLRLPFFSAMASKAFEILLPRNLIEKKWKELQYELKKKIPFSENVKGSSERRSLGKMLSPKHRTNMCSYTLNYPRRWQERDVWASREREREWEWESTICFGDELNRAESKRERVGTLLWKRKKQIHWKSGSLVQKVHLYQGCRLNLGK